MAHDAGALAERRQRQRQPQGRQVGPQQVHRHASSPARRSASSAWAASGWRWPSGPQGFDMTGGRLRPLPLPERAAELGHRERLASTTSGPAATSSPCTRRSPTETRDMIGADAMRQDEAGGPDHQLRARRPDQRGRPARRAERRQGRRRRHRRLRARAAAGRPSADQASQRAGHPAPRGVDRGGRRSASPWRRPGC